MTDHTAGCGLLNPIPACLNKIIEERSSFSFNLDEFTKPEREKDKAVPLTGNLIDKLNIIKSNRRNRSLRRADEIAERPQTEPQLTPVEQMNSLVKFSNAVAD